MARTPGVFFSLPFALAPITLRPVDESLEQSGRSVKIDGDGENREIVSADGAKKVPRLIPIAVKDALSGWVVQKPHPVQGRITWSRMEMISEGTPDAAALSETMAAMVSVLPPAWGLQVRICTGVPQ